MTVILQRRPSQLKRLPSEESSSSSSASSEGVLEVPENSFWSAKFRAAVTCVIVCLRFRSTAKKLKAASSLAKSDRELDEKPSDAESSFHGEALNASAIMSKTLSFMRQMHTVEEITQRAVVASVHKMKVYTLRVCWRDHIVPLRAEVERGKFELAKAKERFAESRSSFLKELSALRDAQRCRGDPTEGLMNMDPMMYFGPEHMCGSTAELECLSKAVTEMVKVVFDTNPRVQKTIDFGQLERIRQQTESEEVTLLRKQLRETAKELRDMKERERVKVAKMLQAGIRRQSAAGLEPNFSSDLDDPFRLDSCCESAILKVTSEKEELETQLKAQLQAMHEQYGRLKDGHATLRAQIESLTEEKERLQERLDTELEVRARKESLRTSRATASIGELEAKNASIRELEAKNADLEKLNALLQKDLSLLQAGLDCAETSVADLQVTDLQESNAMRIRRNLFARTSQAREVDLCRVASKGDVDSLRQVLRKSGGLQHLNVPNYDKRTALHLAASEGFEEVVTCLVDEFAANVNAVDRWGSTPLDDAIRGGHVHIAELLGARGGTSGQSAEQRAEEEEEDEEASFEPSMLAYSAGRGNFTKAGHATSHFSADFHIASSELPSLGCGTGKDVLENASDFPGPFNVASFGAPSLVVCGSQDVIEKTSYPTPFFFEFTNFLASCDSRELETVLHLSTPICYED
eukprot:TRINITY_DN7117_c0_g3_i1.p1 TRINITY_DN7117_c0_g3~~TRINITY_DN7117_c0_g3_i1.p1  ORF type:complete len:694 (-),score=160.93 TRINITY_DN7117_c0_g3_i1:51-2132(-)